VVSILNSPVSLKKRSMYGHGSPSQQIPHFGAGIPPSFSVHPHDMWLLQGQVYLHMNDMRRPIRCALRFGRNPYEQSRKSAPASAP